MGNKNMESFESDINHILMMSIRDVAEKLGNEIEQAYEDAIQKFYDDYTGANRPKRYKRTKATFYGSDHYKKPFNLKNIGTRRNILYKTGIKVNWQNILDGYGHNPYTSSWNSHPDFDKHLLPWVFYRTFTFGIHGMTPEESEQRGLEWHKKPMVSPPQKRMDKAMKRISKKKHIDEIMNKTITDNLNKYLK